MKFNAEVKTFKNSTTLEAFFESHGVEIHDMGVGYIVIVTDNDRYYEIPFEEKTTGEIMVTFDKKQIYEVTESYQEG